jgi:hypothetical protein
MDEIRYRFRVLTRSETHGTGMGVVVTVSILVGKGDQLSLSGTLSMTEAEWLPLKGALQQSLGERVEFEEIRRAPAR